jgi:hypothetical protein
MRCRHSGRGRKTDPGSLLPSSACRVQQCFDDNAGRQARHKRHLSIPLNLFHRGTTITFSSPTRYPPIALETPSSPALLPRLTRQEFESLPPTIQRKVSRIHFPSSHRLPVPGQPRPLHITCMLCCNATDLGCCCVAAEGAPGNRHITKAIIASRCLTTVTPPSSVAGHHLSQYVGGFPMKATSAELYPLLRAQLVSSG